VGKLFGVLHDECSIIIGNGGGSFGHYVAQKYQPKNGESFSPQGVCEIHDSVVNLNQVVVRALLDVSVPAFSVSPASCMCGSGGDVDRVNIAAIETLLERNMVPVIYGDIVPDSTRNGTILSTETLFSIVVDALESKYTDITVVYAGQEAGVFDSSGALIPSLCVKDVHAHADTIQGSSGIDITGGMRQKVKSALDMAQRVSRVYIVSGLDDSIVRVALGEDAGTRVLRDTVYI
jgi:isopentenyl phosphate kinase